VVILRTFMALLAGFATMAVLVMGVTALLSRLTPGWVGSEGRPGPGYVFVNLGYSFLAAAAGGYVTAWVADVNPLPLVLGLAVVVLVMGAISALQARGRQPVWYQVALLVISPLGVVAGGLVRLRATGVL
jgi:hypothetical protein